MENKIDFTAENIKQAIETIKSIPDPYIDHIKHNCTEDQLIRVFGERKKINLHKVYFGVPIYERSYIVPKNEIWFMDKYGNVIDRFKIS